MTKKEKSRERQRGKRHLKWLEAQPKLNPKPASTRTNSTVTQIAEVIEQDNRKDEDMGTCTTDPVNNDSINESNIGCTKENVAQPVLDLPSVPLFHTVQSNPSVPNDNNITTFPPTMATVDNKKDDHDTKTPEETNTNNDVLSREEDVVNDSEDGPSFLDYGDDDINTEEAVYQDATNRNNDVINITNNENDEVESTCIRQQDVKEAIIGNTYDQLKAKNTPIDYL